MSNPHRRPWAALLAVVLTLLVAAPVAAVDPTPAPAPEDGPAPLEGSATSPTIHAEMETRYTAERIGFVPGGRPQVLRPDTVTGGEVQAGVAAELPNGLSREVFGYLPYWALTDSLVAHLDYDLLSTIAYFGVPATSTGTLNKSGVGWNGWNSATMTNVIDQAHAEGVKVVLTVTMMAWNYDYTAMSTLLNSSTRRTQLANEIAATVAARNADGVNLDFEPMPNSLESEYTAFVRKVKAELVRVGAGSYLTVAATGGAASWDEGYELVDNGDANVHSLVTSGGADAIMVMAYDFNWSGSRRAGAVAPIDSPYVLDSRDAMSAYLARVPASRLIWGVPYYGRAWTTTGSAQNSVTCVAAGTCDAASWASRYVDAREAAADHGRRWDSAGQVPWYRYRSSTYDTYVQGYYDDSASLNVKYDLVKANGLRGIGIWHLLMDGSRSELWNRLASEFKDLPFTDIADSPFVNDIIWLSDSGITRGCGATTFCPRDPVTRAQMATLLARAFALPAATQDYFADDEGLVHEDNINRLAQAGITLGCNATSFCPQRTVSRAAMASFLGRALGLAPATRDWFSDDDGSIHHDAINRLAEAGITTGCGDGRYCPRVGVTRQQMAAFLHRALGS
jgi:spore germination protein YaaH